VLLGSWLFTLLSAHTALLGLILGLIFLWPAIRMVYEGVGQQRMPKREGGGHPRLRLGDGRLRLHRGDRHRPGRRRRRLRPGAGADLPVRRAGLHHHGHLAGDHDPAGGRRRRHQAGAGLRDLPTGLLLAAGTIVGAQVGAAIIKRIKPATLKLIFGLYFLYVAVKFITAFFGIRIW
jgi:uncharacterized membrane protein YfcA